MRKWVRGRVLAAYESLLKREIEGVPEHVAVIQDGNRRYARRRGDVAHEGHRAGAETTKNVLEWCEELGIEELTLYAFSMENFDRPRAEREALFDLIAEKLRELADTERVHESGLRIRAVGDADRLPERVREAIAYAEDRTEGYDQHYVNVALAYGGRAELLEAAREVATEVAEGDLDPEAVDAREVASRLYRQPSREVDLIVRTGGEERTSNFLPWHANGNEAAVVFSAPYWPGFSKRDFLRAIRTYQHRRESWRRTRVRRALALVQAFGEDVPGAWHILDQSHHDVEHLRPGADLDGQPSSGPAD